MKRGVALALVAMLFVGAAARAEDSGGLDWSAWQRMPVLEDGRIMPLDSFARARVKKICGDIYPLIGRLGTLPPEQAKSLAPDELKKWISENRPRRFLAAELLYSWTVEPQEWRDIPFIYAQNAALRTEVLDVPLYGEDGSRLTQVSPRQIHAAEEKLQKVFAEAERLDAEARQKKQTAKLSAVQVAARELVEAASLYERLAFNPARDNDRRWIAGDLGSLAESWGQFSDELMQLPVLEPHPEMYRLVQQTQQAVLKLSEIYRPMQSKRLSLTAGDAAAAELRRLSSLLAGQVDDLAESKVPDNFGATQSDRDELKGDRQSVARSAKDIALAAAKLHWGIYDAAGEGIFLVPSLEPTALEADRHRSEIQPWISLYALLYGSPKLLVGYPADHVRQVRDAWDVAGKAYLDRGAADRRQQFAERMSLFTARVRALAAEIEPARQELPIIDRDKVILAKTAYPSPATTDAEVLYNRVDPFHWAWFMSLAAAAILGLSYAGLRKPLFALGITTLIGSIALLACGFAVRIYITHWSPVTSMSETIVWVTMVIALLSLWLTFLPLLGPASKAAWNWNAIPGSWEYKRSKPDNSPFANLNGAEVPLRAVALTLRLVIFVVGLYIVGVIPAIDHFFAHSSPGDTSYGGAEYKLVSLLPRVDIGSTLPGASTTLVWLASMFVAGALTWYVPRLIPSAVMGVGSMLTAMRREESAEKVEKIYLLRIVAMGGALFSACAAIVANYAPFPRDIQALMPVLRSNFWLGIHVLTIVTSYAFVAIAWLIGNLALGIYLFGSYRTIESRSRKGRVPMADFAESDDESDVVKAVAVEGERRPPAICGTLANLNYRVVQIAVLLLAAGTILGGLWADVSWGRFWGWDPKEVGALIALLILLTALHGRRAGWPGDLSLAIGSVFGFFGVLWAWYVVNFLLNTGLHAYATGEGGGWIWLVSVIGGQLAFIVAAVIRATAETGKRAA